ncbi:hypothetical protein EYF80_024668 [Liparis tanakae]|uniref:Uncharacterized protein n=1 Tax=Liparis tanakae TaxID=230148 RepID=A0A4Z2HGR0_9TELE|nr:hypothetical protein EYF80_024668 [Liparis tanakae]
MCSREPTGCPKSRGEETSPPHTDHKSTGSNGSLCFTAVPRKEHPLLSSPTLWPQTHQHIARGRVAELEEDVAKG